MNKKDLWAKFWTTGSVFDYLEYKKKKIKMSMTKKINLKREI